MVTQLMCDEAGFKFRTDSTALFINHHNQKTIMRDEMFETMCGR